jgi:TIR domain
MKKSSHLWDVFISCASENRDAVAEPLASRLRDLGMRVWFDMFKITVGDSIRERIDHGLSRSRFGVVILSQAFFSTTWR